ADLLAAARQGKQDALALLHEALEEKLHKAARRRLGRVLRQFVDSMDIVQSAQKSLLICLRQGKYDIPDEEKLTALAMRILQRKVARKWRKARHDLNLQDRLAKESNSRNSSPAGAVKAMEDADLIQHLMRYMNKTEKELVGLIREGHTITDAAKLL